MTGVDKQLTLQLQVHVVTVDIFLNKAKLCFSGTRKLVGYLVAHNWWQLGPNVAHNNTTIPAYIG